MKRRTVSYYCNKNGWESAFVKRQKLNEKLRLEGKKQCATCNEIKSIDNFSADHRAVGGKSSQCNVCRAPKINEWQNAHYDRQLKASREWKNRNPDYVKQYSSQYHRNNKEKRKAYLREWYQANPGMKRVYRQQRDRRQRNAKGHFTLEQLMGRIQYYGGRCYLCGCNWYALPKFDQTIDHVIALHNGGSNWPANLRPACRSCNSSKQ